ncbi:MAG: carboxypeptidase-like regulatory domain-containing protein [Saprospiraceae bacterium]|nr:carboxypeptidase-like regulatory domain-containing protein [Saprospiraceae bacterium]
MKVKFNYLVLVVFALLLTSVTLVGQSTVRGSVKSATEGEPLIGVTVLVKGTTFGTATDIDGNFEIQVDDLNATLVFSYTGFASQEVALGGRTTVEVSMDSESTLLDEVVVTAYGTTRKEP